MTAPEPYLDPVTGEHEHIFYPYSAEECMVCGLTRQQIRERVLWGSLADSLYRIAGALERIAEDGGTESRLRPE